MVQAEGQCGQTQGTLPSVRCCRERPGRQPSVSTSQGPLDVSDVPTVHGDGSQCHNNLTPEEGQAGSMMALPGLWQRLDLDY